MVNRSDMVSTVNSQQSTVNNADGAAGIDIRGFVSTTAKVGQVPIVFRRSIRKGFKVKTGRVIPEVEGWYISLTLENQTVPLTVAEIQPTAKKSLGIDLGLTNYAYLSNGERVKNPRFLRTSAEKLATLQAKLAKRVKGSKSGQTIKKMALNYESGGGSTSLKKSLASREKEACGLTVRP